MNSSFLARSAALRASLRQQGRVLLRVTARLLHPSTRKPRVPGAPDLSMRVTEEERGMILRGNAKRCWGCNGISGQIHGVEQAF